MKKIYIILLMAISLITYSNNEDIDIMQKRMLEFSNGIPYKTITMTEDEKIKNIEKRNSAATKAMKSLEVLNDDNYFMTVKKNEKGKVVNKAVNDALVLIKAYNTEGTDYYKKQDVKDKIIDVFTKVSNNGYVITDAEIPKKSFKSFGNWWNFEIGIPRSITEALIIGKDIFPESLRDKLIEETKDFQPDPIYSGNSSYARKNLFSNNDKRESTGANRIDVALISLQRGIVTSSSEEIKKAINAAFEVGAYMDDIRNESRKKGEKPSEKNYDGFYKDGSYLQHISVPYSGTYGEVLLNGLAQINYLISGTEYAIKNENINNIYEGIINGFNWFYINGGVNDSVSGRAISREGSNDLTRLTKMAGIISLLSEGASPYYKEKLQGIVKRIEKGNKEFSHIERTSSNLLKSVMKNIVEDDSIKEYKPEGVKVFPNMDRAVQFGKNDGKIVISMHSSRIANFEIINGENVKGWHTGDGMTYIYTTASNSFVDYWPTVDKYMLPGTTESISTKRIVTVDKKTNQKRTNGSRQYNNKSTKDFVGGVYSDDKGIVAMDFSSWNDFTTAKKSYVLFNDLMLAMGSNIHSTDGEIVTTVDNRIVNDGIKVYVDDNELIDEKDITKDNIVNFYDENTKDNIGYKILDDNVYKVRLKDYSGSFEEIGNSKNTDLITKKYFQEYVNHGNNPSNASYTYLVMPMYTREQIKNFNFNDIKILSQNEKQHSIRYKNTLFTNFFEKGKIEDVLTHTPISLIKEENGYEMDITLSDPTQKLEKTKLEIDGVYDLETKNEDILVEYKDNKTILDINLSNSYFSKLKLVKEIKKYEKIATEFIDESSSNNKIKTFSSNLLFDVLNKNTIVDLSYYKDLNNVKLGANISYEIYKNINKVGIDINTYYKYFLFGVNYKYLFNNDADNHNISANIIYTPKIESDSIIITPKLGLKLNYSTEIKLNERILVEDNFSSKINIGSEFRFVINSFDFYVEPILNLFINNKKTMINKISNEKLEIKGNNYTFDTTIGIEKVIDNYRLGFKTIISTNKKILVGANLIYNF